MNSNVIKVTFTYNGEKKGPYIHNINDKIKEICLKFTEEEKINFDELMFVAEGRSMNEEYYDKPISKIASEDDKTDLNILVYDLNSSEKPQIVNDQEPPSINKDNKLNNNIY